MNLYHEIMRHSGGPGLPWLGALGTVGARSTFDEKEIRSDCRWVWRGKNLRPGEMQRV